MTISFARNQGERIATEFGNFSLPIDVVGIAKHLGMNVIETTLGDGISGLLITRDGEAWICVEKSNNSERKRFTIAHEIGHHVLGHQHESGSHVHVDRGNVISQRSLRASQGIDPKEVEANQFAACMLMPSQLIRSHVAKISTGLTEQHVEMLAQTFKVSEQAMTIRLTTLKLL